jgi:enoyl-CoA hydratase
MTDKVLAQVEEGIVWITLNNPEHRNAISLEMWRSLAGMLSAFDADNGIRLAVITGAGGKAFASGGDISEYAEHRADSSQREEYGAILHGGLRALAQFSKPLIAMIRGYCIGAGLAIALSADMRFATPTSRFGVPAAKLGLGFEYPGVAALAMLVGPAAAADILFSARQIEAADAERMGLINFVVPDDALESRVRDYATLISENAPLTIHAAKAAIRAYMHYALMPDFAAVEKLVSRCFDSEDYKEGRLAFFEKRKPKFQGR